MSTEFVDTTVGRLHVDIEGDGPPAVLWHSLFVDSTSWELVRPQLRKHRRLVIVDGPSHGRSGRPATPYDVPACAVAARELLDTLDVSEPVDWVGNAWGGHVGLLFAAGNPERCRSVVTIGTPVHGLARKERLLQIYPLVALYRIAGPITFLRKTLTDALLGSDAVAAQPDLATRVIDAFCDADRAAMYEAMQSLMVHRKDLSARLASIAAPTAMITGTDDEMWDYTMAQAAAAKMPNATAIPVRGAGHIAPLLLDPDLIAHTIVEFWNSSEHRSQRA